MGQRFQNSLVFWVAQEQTLNFVFSCFQEAGSSIEPTISRLWFQRLPKQRRCERQLLLNPQLTQKHGSVVDVTVSVSQSRRLAALKTRARYVRTER